MGARVDVRCALCGAPVSAYRQCPDKACALDIGVCKAHGGDAAAIERMQDHIAEHRAPVPTASVDT